MANPGGLTYHPPAFYDPIPSRGVYEIIHACFIGVYCPVWKQQRPIPRSGRRFEWGRLRGRGLRWGGPEWWRLNGSASHGSGRRPRQPNRSSPREFTATASESTGLSTGCAQRAHGEPADVAREPTWCSAPGTSCSRPPGNGARTECPNGRRSAARRQQVVRIIAIKTPALASRSVFQASAREHILCRLAWLLRLCGAICSCHTSRPRRR